MGIICFRCKKKFNNKKGTWLELESKAQVRICEKCKIEIEEQNKQAEVKQ